MTRRAALAIVLASLAPACQPAGSDLEQVLPDERIKINLPVSNPYARTVAPTEWATFYLLTANVTEEVNGMVGTVLYWVDTITSQYPPSYVDASQNAAEWGPWDDGPLDPAETLLWVTHDTTTDAYAWGFDRWSKASDPDAATTVILGEVDPGATHEVNSGRFTMDFTANNAIDPTDETTGLFSVDYDITEEGVSGEATFTDFGPDALDANYAYSQVFDGAGQMDLGTSVDMNPQSGTGLLESWLVRSRWEFAGAGRSDVIVTGGDLGSTEVQVSECWDTSFQRVYYSESLTGKVEGDISLCVYADASFPG